MTKKVAQHYSGAGSGARTATLTEQALPVQKLILRKNSQDPVNDTVAGFTASQDVRFELNARGHRPLSIGFGGFRVEFGLKSLLDFQVREARVCFGRRVLILRLVLREPPMCFHLVVADNNYRENGAIQHPNSLIWKPTPNAEIERGTAGTWERTLDPSEGSAFAHCLLYDLVIEEIYQRKLFKQLNYLKLYHETPIPAQVSLIQPQVNALQQHDWIQFLSVCRF